MSRRARRPEVLLLVCLPLAACGLLPCGPCGGDGALAVLTQLGPGVQRDVAAAAAQWTPAAVGDRFQMGDGLRTPAKQVALLELLPTGGMRVEPETVVRFQNTPGDAQAPRVGVESGEIVLDTGELEVGIDTGRGIARVAPGTRVRVGAEQGSVKLRVLVGQLQLDGEDGLVTVGAGEDVTVRVGELLLDPPEPADEAAAPVAVAVDASVANAQPEPPVEAADDPASQTSERNPFDSPPQRIDLRLVPGEIAIVHDPSPPTALAIPVPCAGEGTVEVGRGVGDMLGSVKLAGEARLSLGGGAYRYRVRCAEGKGTRGRFIVRKDAGTRRLPRTPPRVTVDADGRPYTVRYQNLLPELTFAWPRAPKASAYELRIVHAGKKRVHKGSGPRIALASGKVGEGTHRFTFAAGGVSSKQGVLKVAFDNTASAAYVSSPVDGAARGGAKTSVAGAALAGSRVSVAGAAVATNRQGRFRSDIVADGGQASVAIRVQHPSSGIHYYLRHLAE